MRQKYDEGYLGLLEKVKNGLPNYYGSILKHKYPNVDSGQVYNVIHKGVQNWEVLNLLAEIAGVETLIKIETPIKESL